jgi:hypothetical protein
MSSFRFWWGSAFVFLLLGDVYTLAAQVFPDGYWQQRIYCQMTVDFDVSKHQYTGTQRMVYTNNSPDTLDRMFYHLYFNAFQQGSEMHAWTKRLPDPDTRILKKLGDIQPHERGYLRARSLRQDGQEVFFEESRTILEVRLAVPLPPGRSTVMDMEFEGQVPIQVRRAGRYNDEGVAYSMAQWFPKVCNYDRQGWHANPYVQREFYGVWGDYDVTIHIDRTFILGGTGYIQNPQEVGSGYEDPALPLVQAAGDKKRWHFFAPNVHDFAWAADPGYTHLRRTMHDGTEFHFLYKRTRENRDAWEALPAIMDTALMHINRRFGAYPYRQYSIIQGGDGGMEYPMATLITGNRPLRSLVGVSVHELMHMWYQMMMGSNEALYAWLDEGFTSYATTEIMATLFPDEAASAMHQRSYMGYRGLVRSGYEEPLTTHADHFMSNYAYGVAAYSKGAIFLHQLGYVIGQEALDRSLLAYYHAWRFRHPTGRDFLRVAERISGIELDWYYEYWVETVKQIDYAVDSAWMDRNELVISLRNTGSMPMPLDVAVRTADGRVTRVHIPLDIMRGFKREDRYFLVDYVAPVWPWTFERYELRLPGLSMDGPVEIIIDPTRRMADVDLEDNSYRWEK